MSTNGETARERGDRWLTEVGHIRYDDQRENEGAKIIGELSREVGIAWEAHATAMDLADRLAGDVERLEAERDALASIYVTAETVPVVYARPDGAVVAEVGICRWVGERREVQRAAAAVEDQCARLAYEERQEQSGSHPAVGKPEGVA
jgi:hypothetical protein